jgi:hypothetical protein
MTCRLLKSRPKLVFVSIALLLSITSLCAAQSGVVVGADYGANRTWVDVTNQVRGMVRNGQLNFRVSTGAFGISDPVPNVPKTLRLRVRDYNGRTQNYTYRENDTVNLQLQGNWTNPPNRPGNGYGRLNADDQKRFDSYYSRWLDYQRQNNFGEIRSMEKRMYDVYQKYNIPSSVPFAQVASNNLGQPGPGWGGWNDLRIISAKYGNGYRTADVTARLQGMVNNGTIRVRVNNDSMGGDPAPNQSKTLHLQYFYQGRQRSHSVREGDTLQIP